MTDVRKYTCPCCGYLTIDEPPGSYDICHVCFWEDDPVQMLDPWYSGGANRLSLEESQKSVAETGACDANGLEHALGVQPDDCRDPQWRLVTEADRNNVKKPRDLGDEDWQELKNWYYWLQ